MAKAKKEVVVEPGACPEVDRAVAEIRAKWGQGSIHAPNEELHIDRPVLATSVPQIDGILGNGGFLRGTIVELYGEFGAGKSTIALQLIAEAQKNDLVTLFIDMEHSLSIDYAEKLGVDMNKVYITQPENMESALGVLETMVSTGKIGLVVVDSLASLVPESEVVLEAGKEPPMALQARHLSLWFRRFSPTIAKTDTLVVFTNQLRDKVGSYVGGSTTPGGRAMKFYASYRLEVKIIKKIVEAGGGCVVGNRLQITAVKNRFAHPYQSTEVTLMFGEGVDIVGSIVDEGVALGLIEKGGNWLSLNEGYFSELVPEIVQKNGKMAFREYLIENKEVFDLLEAAVRDYSTGAVNV